MNDSKGGPTSEALHAQTLRRAPSPGSPLSEPPTPSGDVLRVCDLCSEPLPVGTRSDARFCGVACRNAARGTAERHSRLILPGDGVRLRTSAELTTAAHRFTAAVLAGDDQSILATESTLFDGELHDFLIALAHTNPKGPTP